MLDPYIRKTLTPLPSASNQRAAKFQTQLQLPDVYGVFTFRVNYKRPGYTYLVDQSTVALRPFRHDEYPRFLTAAYPYYAGAASMSAGFLAFVVVWLSVWGTEKAMKVDKVKSEKQEKVVKSEKVEKIKEEKPDDRAATSETGPEKKTRRKK
ncbi:Oligosaccharyltransferase 48 kDa subunit beta-domain-containing protein [Endogone sp. FLAS-F59071]|nr:Oligosaccharyltransferase 48 kDa subunit beta-domain-containing protein [Endogone sp. FLAS-F59071]|eukprot:RUS17004.1 Oligosaccharyltransferase 48 kDa subunit beta-domain-containing protein [Endogone sp. FLAS-F59071]